MSERPGPVSPFIFPLSLWQSSLEVAFLSVEALSVFGLRMMLLSGARPMANSEPVRMVMEKPPAFLASGVEAWSAAASGKSADQIMTASLRPLRAKTRANADRLLKEGAAPARTPSSE
ncbi:MAG: antifreeze protein [Pseudomonadota bacterium]